MQSKVLNIKKLFTHNRTPGEIIFYTFCFIFFAIYSLSVLFVLGWSVLSSLKGTREFYNFPFDLPKKWLFSNYIEAFNRVNIKDTSLIGMFINSIWFSFGSVLISNLTCLLVGYVFAKYKFRGKNVIYAVNLFTMIVPIFSSGAAGYQLILKLGIDNSPLFLIKYISCLGMSFMIYSSLFNGVSNSYIESATIDGAGHLTIFFKIVFPQVLPTFFALSTTGIIGAWNDWSTPLYYLEEMPTLAYGLFVFKAEMTYASADPLYFATAMMCCAPVIIMFSVSQRKIMTSVYTGGLKG